MVNCTEIALENDLCCLMWLLLLSRIVNQVSLLKACPKQSMLSCMLQAFRETLNFDGGLSIAEGLLTVAECSVECCKIVLYKSYFSSGISERCAPSELVSLIESSMKNENCQETCVSFLCTKSYGLTMGLWPLPSALRAYAADVNRNRWEIRQIAEFRQTVPSVLWSAFLWSWRPV